MRSTSLHRALQGLGVLSAFGVLVACGTLQSTPVAPFKAATGASLPSCETLTSQLRLPNTRIESAASVAAGAVMQGDKAVPAHCLVKGRMHERKGSDGRDYAIGFEMRLPVAWNGRFYYQGNGGLDGAVVPALGALGGGPLTGALMQGFAVISSDAGHSGPQTPFFGLEPQARLDYGYQAVEKLTPMAKQLIASAYGKGPDRSYIGGCSNGGRHAMVAASRLGDQYDGYLVGAPGYRLPYAALAQIWGAQQWAPLATPGATVKNPLNPNGTLPDLASAFTPQERQTVAKAIAQKCDALDGAKDGMVQATQACQAAFNVKTDVATCTGERNGACLTAVQKDVVARVFGGAQTADGQRIYASFPYDTGVAGANWGTWKFVDSLIRDPLAIGTIFSVPPTPLKPLEENVTARLAMFSATNDTYRESGWSLMTPPGESQPDNLAALRGRGAKVVLYHGVSDAIFSAEDTRQWVERVGKAGLNPGSDFARYFPVPGMNHCSMGPAADQFDLLGPLVKWVEQGVAPQAVVASVRGVGNAGSVNTELPTDWSAKRTRPLCAHPTVATYKGSGSLEDASNFACK
ncbi:tannase/feruloyl esterase family alpha/beta hydrolase [Limnohabitans sp. T6-20]|uniref:tannase/feruloyl esterase family alpha/beta hydrolase n=1 Tax=Limnohabitans sp. T6-20 TaxID=1100725 RepID=UPI000D3CA598|nr:tannase/feruloyl esterase family alpha/beta hydrolase [Limnohabitans sp. T6-20]PUE07692.1 tannase/feruloyl esterase family alpha/beta hydrolase [Limnohabitans sp. T6-20]